MCSALFDFTTSLTNHALQGSSARTPWLFRMIAPSAPKSPIIPSCREKYATGEERRRTRMTPFAFAVNAFT